MEIRYSPELQSFDSITTHHNCILFSMLHEVWHISPTFGKPLHVKLQLRTHQLLTAEPPHTITTYMNHQSSARN